jgi:hypothetical protein
MAHHTRGSGDCPQSAFSHFAEKRFGATLRDLRKRLSRRNPAMLPLVRPSNEWQDITGEVTVNASIDSSGRKRHTT